RLRDSKTRADIHCSWLGKVAANPCVTLGGADNLFHPDLRQYARFLPRTLMTPTTVKVFNVVARFRKSRVPNASGIRLHRPSPTRNAFGWPRCLASWRPYPAHCMASTP